MAKYPTRSMVGLAAALALVAAACGGDSTEDATPATTAATATTAAAPATTAPAGQEGGAAADDSTATTTDSAAGEEGDAGNAPEQSGAGDLSLVPPGETDIVGNPAGQGFVELDGMRYDFILNGACQKIFGGVQAAGAPADGFDGGVNSIIPPEDWETDTAAGWDPPSVEIAIGDDNWQAQAGSEHVVGGETVALSPEQSSVTSFTNDGSRVAGDAVFFSTYNFQEVESASGSFEFYCP